jgi:hypothetical protein
MPIKNMKVVASITLGALCLIISCKSGIDDTLQYNSTTGQLTKEVSVGNMSYKVQHKPIAVMVANEGLTEEATKHRLNSLKGTVWFSISLSVKDFSQSPLRYNISGLDEYNERLNYYLRQAPKDVYLLYGKDTLTVDSYWFENNQNLVPFETMLLGFKLPNLDTIPQFDLQLSYYDAVFKNGIIKAFFPKASINHF